mmetsp:Transcript_12559/g.29541  ORF Transcript_12559/g.29541 Transcript_12559/m.29541 type:complete len:353 (+) Transcript_12559:164-1222(+)
MRSSLFHNSASLARVAGASAIVGGMAGFSAAATPASECHGTGSGHGEGSKLPRQYAHSHATQGKATSSHLLFGVPKKGRLHEKVKKMLDGAGIEYSRPDRLDIAHCSNLPISIVFLPASDIATYVGEGNVDMGITGEDIIGESEVDVEVLMKLGLGKCRLSVQAPVGEVTDVRSLAGKRIVTSFPNLTRNYFDAMGADKPTQIKCISGSVEASCGLGLADGIVDLVETGTTMRAAGLEEVSTIMKTECVLIANKSTSHPELVETIRKRIAGYLTATKYVMVTYNIHRSSLERAKNITPGKKSPSIMPLERGDWVAVSALVLKKSASTVMDELEDVGATDILLTSIVNSRMGD